MMKTSYLLSLTVLTVLVATPLSMALAETAAFDGAVLPAASSVYDTGDANGDGVVSAADLGLLLSSYNLIVPDGDGWGIGDFNGDGTVNITDLGLLLSHYTPGVSASIVPEPSTLLLAAIGAVGGLFSLAWKNRK
jgi:hypothetical protein